ncbi:activating transcription factor 7-interacting protein 2 isoform X2 [Cyclopterus lumpus]|uniref:Activating transcription factor 7-interacting protein Fn3 domain-containing protein n=2 Tax=Cyclopterus lumpus TaxID=8103 RepID=A0A8C2WWR5_CYCLU|nr:activating transcription factor 7-interacting protein 2 isoform X2 [Cyclopterus lumpus]
MQTLIEQEVHTAVQKKESKLKALIETIEKLDRDVDYMSSIQKLQTRINTVTKRAEAAIAFMTEKKSPVPSSFVNIKRRDSEDETMETAALTGIKSTNCMDDKGEDFEMMENTKQALQNMYANNEALKGAMEDLKEELPPPVLTPYGSPEAKVGAKRPKEEQVMENIAAEPVQSVEPKVRPVKVEPLPLNESDGPNNTDSEQEEPLYPPLPTQAFPVTLNMEAALYNIPLRPKVRLALIRNMGLSLLWNTEEEDAHGPPMCSYSVFITVEKEKGSNVFPDWTLAQVEAKPLPMCMMINKYKLGRKVCVAVVGKDKFGRFGPYSSVETASLPD